MAYHDIIHVIVILVINAGVTLSRPRSDRAQITARNPKDNLKEW
jgi:hypothetical protein